MSVVESIILGADHLSPLDQHLERTCEILLKITKRLERKRGNGTAIGNKDRAIIINAFSVLENLLDKNESAIELSFRKLLTPILFILRINNGGSGMSSDRKTVKLPLIAEEGALRCLLKALETEVGGKLARKGFSELFLILSGMLHKLNKHTDSNNDRSQKRVNDPTATKGSETSNYVAAASLEEKSLLVVKCLACIFRSVGGDSDANMEESERSGTGALMTATSTEKKKKKKEEEAESLGRSGRGSNNLDSSRLDKIFVSPAFKNPLAFGVSTLLTFSTSPKQAANRKNRVAGLQALLLLIRAIHTSENKNRRKRISRNLGVDRTDKEREGSTKMVLAGFYPGLMAGITRILTESFKQGTMVLITATMVWEAIITTVLSNIALEHNIDESLTSLSSSPSPSKTLKQQHLLSPSKSSLSDLSQTLRRLVADMKKKNRIEEEEELNDKNKEIDVKEKKNNDDNKDEQEGEEDSQDADTPINLNRAWMRETISNTNLLVKRVYKHFSSYEPGTLSGAFYVQLTKTTVTLIKTSCNALSESLSTMIDFLAFVSASRDLFPTPTENDDDDENNLQKAAAKHIHELFSASFNPPPLPPHCKESDRYHHDHHHLVNDALSQSLRKALRALPRVLRSSLSPGARLQAIRTVQGYVNLFQKYLKPQLGIAINAGFNTYIPGIVRSIEIDIEDAFVVERRRRQRHPQDDRFYDNSETDLYDFQLSFRHARGDAARQSIIHLLRSIGAACGLNYLRRLIEAILERYLPIIPDSDSSSYYSSSLVTSTTVSTPALQSGKLLRSYLPVHLEAVLLTSQLLLGAATDVNKMITTPPVEMRKKEKGEEKVDEKKGEAEFSLFKCSSSRNSSYCKSSSDVSSSSSSQQQQIEIIMDIVLSRWLVLLSRTLAITRNDNSQTSNNKEKERLTFIEIRRLEIFGAMLSKGIRECALSVGSKSFKLRLMETLFPLLEGAGSSALLISQAARASLASISDTCGYGIKEIAICKDQNSVEKTEREEKEEEEAEGCDDHIHHLHHSSSYNYYHVTDMLLKNSDYIIESVSARLRESPGSPAAIAAIHGLLLAASTSFSSSPSSSSLTTPRRRFLLYQQQQQEQLIVVLLTDTLRSVTSGLTVMADAALWQDHSSNLNHDSISGARKSDDNTVVGYLKVLEGVAKAVANSRRIRGGKEGKGRAYNGNDSKNDGKKTNYENDTTDTSKVTRILCNEMVLNRLAQYAEAERDLKHLEEDDFRLSDEDEDKKESQIEDLDNEDLKANNKHSWASPGLSMDERRHLFNMERVEEKRHQKQQIKESKEELQREEEEETKEPSPTTNILIQILKVSRSFLTNTDNKQMIQLAFSILNNGLMALKNEERHLLPIVAQTWDSLRPHYTFNFNENISITKRHHHNLNWSNNDHRDHPDHALLANVRILEGALKVLETLGKLCPAFLTQRFAEHVWPGLRKLLLYSQGNLRMKSSLNSSALNLSSATITLRQKREQQHDIDFKIQMAILNALEMLVLHAPELAVRVLPDILETVATYIVGTRTLPSSSTALSKLPGEISDAAHQVLVAVGCVDADLVWWHFQDHLSIGNDSNDKECSQNVAIENLLVKIDLVGEQESSESR